MKDKGGKHAKEMDVRRRIFGILSALSLLLCVVLVLLYLGGLKSAWTVGYAATGHYYALSTAPRHSLFLIAFHDRMVVGSGWVLRRDPPGALPMPPSPSGTSYVAIAKPDWNWYGRTDRIKAPPLFDYASFNAIANPGATERIVQVWPIPYIVMGMVLPFWYVVRWVNARRRIRQRLAAGLCLTCGYDLRASKERCPECGTAIPADSAAGSESKAK